MLDHLLHAAVLIVWMALLSVEHFCVAFDM